MSNKVFLRFWMLLAGSVLLNYTGTPAFAQTMPTPAQTQSPSSELSDPTRPEVQPDLSIERDPVPSPDRVVNAPGGAAAPLVPKGQDKIYTLQRDVDEVLLQCTVVDEHGRLVTGLNRDDFRVFEDGAPQTVASFEHRDVPVSMGILVDNSGSMRDKRPAVNAAALDLVRASNREDAAFIVNFADDAYIDQDFTSNISALERGLTRADSRGATALYDAVVASANELAKHAKQPKQVLLIVTDGEDNASRLSLEEAIRRVQALGGPVVYSIGLLFAEDNKEKAHRAKEALEMLSQETGGIAYFPDSLTDVDEIASEVARDIRNQYTLGYHSTKPASLGGYRTVHVEAKSSKYSKLIVRTRKGYYPKQLKQQQ